MPDPPTGRHCHYCHATAGAAPLRLRDGCIHCLRRIDEQRLYFQIPKPFTLAGLRTQARGLGGFLRAAALSISGRTPNARSHGRLRSLQLAVKVWIDHWYVLKPEGWRR